MKAVTLMKVTLCDPHTAFENHGYTAAGEPILKRKVREIAPSLLIDLTSDEFADLAKFEAVRRATEQEVQLGYALPEERTPCHQEANR
jgi:hypothetical protein